MLDTPQAMKHKLFKLHLSASKSVTSQRDSGIEPITLIIFSQTQKSTVKIHYVQEAYMLFRVTTG